ncbi:DinB family protein [Brevibacillus sp. NRS-1366]|uniref:DinB family protein n=1 Tax=Brevibacillus sp. NRS-1366 TaxID=3233899 RepID=UPI003D1CF936
MRMTVPSYLEQIEKSLDELIGLASGLSSEVLHWKPANEAWSIQEVLSHVEEAIPYWVNEMENITSGRQKEWGRTMQDPTRLAAVARAHDISTPDLLSRLQKAKTAIRQELQSIKEEELELEAPSRNPKFGIKPLRFILDHFVVEHIESHIRQVRRNIDQYS